MSLPEDVKAVTVKYIPTTDLSNPVKIAVNHRCRLRMIITRGWNTQVDDLPPDTNQHLLSQYVMVGQNLVAQFMLNTNSISHFKKTLQVQRNMKW